MKRDKKLLTEDAFIIALGDLVSGKESEVRWREIYQIAIQRQAIPQQPTGSVREIAGLEEAANKVFPHRKCGTTQNGHFVYDKDITDFKQEGFKTGAKWVYDSAADNLPVQNIQLSDTAKERIERYQRQMDAHDENFVTSDDIQDLKESYYYKGRRDEAYHSSAAPIAGWTDAQIIEFGEWIDKEGWNRTRFNTWFNRSWGLTVETMNLKAISTQELLQQYKLTHPPVSNGWISIKDRLPLCYKSGNWDGLRSEAFIALCKDEKSHIAFAYSGILDGREFFDFYDASDYEISDVTHWTTLPTKP